MSEYYDKCQFYAGSCHYSSPNHYDPSYVYPGQYGPDQYYPDCYPYYPEHDSIPGPMPPKTPPSEEEDHGNIQSAESSDEIVSEEPAAQVSKSKLAQRTKSRSTLPQVLTMDFLINYLKIATIGQKFRGFISEGDLITFRVGTDTISYDYYNMYAKYCLSTSLCRGGRGSWSGPMPTIIIIYMYMTTDLLITAANFH